jgi:hypothetical protein
MAVNAITRILGDIFRSAMRREGAELTDGQLLGQFLAGGNRVALEILVQRHAAMVWGVCRRTLAHHHAPRMPSRLPSSSCSARRRPSGPGSGWRAGCMAWRSRPRARPGKGPPNATPARGKWR